MRKSKEQEKVEFISSVASCECPILTMVEFILEEYWLNEEIGKDNFKDQFLLIICNYGFDGKYYKTPTKSALFIKEVSEFYESYVKSVYFESKATIYSKLDDVKKDPNDELNWASWEDADSFTSYVLNATDIFLEEISNKYTWGYLPKKQ